jgi:hypothetical protein
VKVTPPRTIRRSKGGSRSATGRRGGHAGILRIDFGPKEEEVSWDEFFKKFDEANLHFLYQDKTKDGNSAASTNLWRG